MRAEIHQRACIDSISLGSADCDRTTKADSSAALGVKELWLVDPPSRTVEVRSNERKRWVESRVFRGDENVACRLISDGRLSMAGVFAE
jgi:Uma2 family endonuclease